MQQGVAKLPVTNYSQVVILAEVGFVGEESRCVDSLTKDDASNRIKSDDLSTNECCLDPSFSSN